MNYVPPIKDHLFNLEHLCELPALLKQEPYREAGMDMSLTRAILEEFGRFAAEDLAPLNQAADQNPAFLQDDRVISSPGFRAVYKHWVEAGWQGLSHPAALGGQGWPAEVAAACTEMLNAACLSFALCPLLTNGAIEVLQVFGSEALKKQYLPYLMSGQWSGTMNLTEAQAGSDLAAISAQARPDGEGRYRLFGTKIFITWGDHDLAENIVHLVLARIEGAPAGVKGLSLFLVPRQLPGEPGRRNDIRVLRLEHKLGIHASPTTVLRYGDGDGAVGWLLGPENGGLRCMFVMMNVARFSVGLQGVGLAERALQAAGAYAHERVQSRPVDGSSPEAVAIVHHPDVRRMLMTMHALTQACRALAMGAAMARDRAHAAQNGVEREQQGRIHAFMVPLVKAYCTEMSLEVSSLAVQVHGGGGFIEETGVAQYYRDARILTIYEGTTAIQANDFLSRKVLHDGGAIARGFLQQIQECEVQLGQVDGHAAARIMTSVRVARQTFEQVLDYMLDAGVRDINAAYAGSVPFLLLAGNLLAGWQMARSWLLAREQLGRAGADADFLQHKLASSEFYACCILPRTAAQRDAILHGAPSVLALPAGQL